MVLGIVRQIVVVIKWFSARLARPAHRQLSTWVHISKEHIRNSIAALGSRIPGLEDRRDVLGCPTDVERTSIFKDEHNGFARGNHGFQHLFLNAWQVQRSS